MKAIKILLIAAATLASANAATVTLSAGFGASGIIVTLDGVNTPYTVEIGGFASSLFTTFPVTTPAVNIAAGSKIAGSFANNNTDPASLTGDAIFVRILLAGGRSAILSTPAGELFPDLTGGLASNSVTMGSSATVAVQSFSGAGLTNVSFATPNVLNFTAVPEPSAALLGAIGALGLLRRRRI